MNNANDIILTDSPIIKNHPGPAYSKIQKQIIIKVIHKDIKCTSPLNTQIIQSYFYSKAIRRVDLQIRKRLKPEEPIT